MGVTTLLQAAVGYIIDHWKGVSLLRFGVACYSLGWFLKALVSTFGQVFFVGMYHNLALILMQTPLDAMMCSRAARAGHYVDEFTVLRELAIVL